MFNRLIKNNLVVIACSFFIIFVAKGIWYINFNGFSIDEYQAISQSEIQINFIRFVSTGRVFRVIPNLIFEFTNTSRFYVYFIGIFLFYAQIIIGCLYALKRLSKRSYSNTEKIIFIGLICLFPYFIEYSFYRDSLSRLAFSFCILASFIGPTLLFSQKKKEIAFGVFLIIYSLGIYQPQLLIIVGICYLGLLHSEQLKENFLKIIILLCSSIIIYYLIAFKIVRIFYADKYQTRPSSINLDGIFSELISIPSKFFNYFISDENLSSPLIGICLSLLMISFLSFLIIRVVREKNEELINKVLKILLGVGVFIIPFILPMLLTSKFFNLTRVYSFAGVAIASAVLYNAYLVPERFKEITKFLSLGLLFGYAVLNNALFTNQLIIANKDINLAQRISNRIEPLEGVTFNNSLITIGVYDRNKMNSKYNHRLIGESVFNSNDRRIVKILNYVSSSNYRFVKDKEKRKLIEEEYKDVLDSWPSSNSIMITEDGTILIKF